MAGLVRRARQVENSGLVRFLGVAGWSAYGLVHLVIAGLALQIALGDRAEHAAPQGAIGKLAAQPMGTVVLVVLAVGLFGFALSQFCLALIGFGWVREQAVRVTRQLGAAGRGVVAVGIGGLAVKQLMGSPTGSGNSQQQGLTATLLTLPAGGLLVGLVAAVVLAVAVATIRRGVLRSFEEDMDMRSFPGGVRRWVRRLGVVGWIAKGLAYLSIAGLFAAAALSVDARKSGGLDQALHLLAGYPFGQVALVAIAAGFAAFAVFCVAAAAAHRR
ncbi:DUF1206 domain-containing protein [Saccharopolyspora erythraea]|uniref:DUF1206 domain-containing protein n=1 Tax=Saccharopolyspora erythraea TaxID=1836 RepID=UPI001BA9D5F1|nr:DUF1206 domain-containing protein [Saccharopolyspora erythraea]QUH02473.1 DUF1206 domain-containing protein [Saccharopolyspora erythraea]